MNHTKGLMPVIICSCIVAAVYVIVAFAIPFLWTPTYWVAFAFGWVAIIVAIATNLYVVRASTTARGVVYRSSLSAVSIMYLIVAAAVSLAFMAFSLAPIWMVVLVQALLIAACVAILVGLASATSHIEDGEAVTRYQTSFIHNMRMQAEAFEALAVTPEARRCVERVADGLRYADPVANSASAAVDQEIAGLMGSLQDALTAQNELAAIALCSQIEDAIKRRAAIVIASK